MPPSLMQGPPLPAEVQAQMAGGPPNPGQPPDQSGGIGSFLSGILGQDNVMSNLAAVRKTKQVMPLLDKLARMVPRLSQDIAEMEQTLSARAPGIAAGPGGPPNMGGPEALPGMPTSPAMGAAALPPPPDQANIPQGVMGVAVQLEVLLPQIASSDPSLQSQVEGFITHMRAEVSKVLEAQGGMTNPPPTDEMLSQVPVTA